MMSCKGCGRKQSWPNFKVHANILPEGLKKPRKTVRIAGVLAEF
jgi:hypothetical protein